MLFEFLLAIIWLAVVSFSFGFALTKQRNLMTFGFGLAVFAVISIAFNLLHIPLNWILFLALALILLAWSIYKKELDLTMPKMPDKMLTIVLIMVAINIYVYYVGATSYQWLEDDDPWVHAMGTVWIAQTGSYSRYFDGQNLTRTYMEPYPPSYDILMGMIDQMTQTVNETLKFFNVLLIGFTLLMAFFAVEALTRDRRLALLATFFLLCLPAFMGHFIWAQTLAMFFLFVALYSMEKLFEFKDNRWILAAGIAIGAIPITQPSVAATFILFILAYIAAKLVYAPGSAKERLLSMKPLILAGVIAMMITAMYYVPVLMKYGPKYTAEGIGLFTGLFTPGDTGDTSGGVVYSLQDVVFVQSQGDIDQQIGIGLVLSLLAVLGFALALDELRKGSKEPWLLFASILLIIGILGVEANATIIPIKLFPHRFWVFLAIPVAMLGAYAYFWIERKVEKHKTALLVAMVIIVFITSAAGKLAVQTSQWPPGVGFYSQDELSGYLSFKASVPAGTKVFPLCSADSKVIGFDLMSEPYVPEYEIFKRTAMNDSVNVVHDFMVSRGYQYMVIDGGCIASLGINGTNALANAYLSSGMFDNAFSNSGMLVLKTKS